MWSAHIRDKLASSSMLLNPTTATRSSSTNLGRMEMCAKRPSFKRTAKPQKLFDIGLQLRIHLCRLRCCTSSVHSTSLNHHDFFHRACIGRGAHLPACTLPLKQPTMTCRTSATTRIRSRNVATGVQPPRQLWMCKRPRQDCCLESHLSLVCLLGCVSDGSCRLCRWLGSALE